MLALALGGCTVAELKSRMSAVEFEHWQAYYAHSPFDDLHRYHRPAACQVSSFNGADFKDVVNFLVNTYEPVINDGLSDIDRSILKAFKK